MNIFKLIGILGLLSIIIGILVRKRYRQDEYFIIGGVFLTAYSIFIQDFIFIILQITFTLAAAYDLIKRKAKKKK